MLKGAQQGKRLLGQGFEPRLRFKGQSFLASVRGSAKIFLDIFFRLQYAATTPDQTSVEDL